MTTDSFKDRKTTLENETIVANRTDTVTKHDTITGGARKNTYTTNSTNSLQHGLQENISERSNSYTDDSTSTTKHEFKRTGNIGVTTSQQMLESERDIAMFNFIGIVAHDIIKSICICIY